MPLPPAVAIEDGVLILLDQTRLPHQTVLERYERAEDVVQAIRELRVRGAPAIGIAAAWGAVSYTHLTLPTILRV